MQKELDEIQRANRKALNRKDEEIKAKQDQKIQLEFLLEGKTKETLAVKQAATYLTALDDY